MARKVVIFLAFLLFPCLGMFTFYMYKDNFKRNFFIKVPKAYCQQTSSFLVPEACCKENPPFLVLLVTTKYNQKKVRMAIRKTWGKEQVIYGKRVVTFFLLGTVPTPPSTDKELFFSEELNTYKDIIQKDFIDSYYNLTFKTLMGLEWISHYCPQTHYIMKTDGDVFVNTLYLVKLLMRKNQTSNLFTGFLKLNDAPIRNIWSKWYISETEYDGNKYPPFCSGTGYVFSVDVAQKIYDISSSIPFFKLEDVYIGMCLDKLKITVQELHQMPVFFPEKVPFSVCAYRNLVTSHGIEPQEIMLYWEALQRAEGERC